MIAVMDRNMMFLSFAIFPEQNVRQPIIPIKASAQSLHNQLLSNRCCKRAAKEQVPIRLYCLSA